MLRCHPYERTAERKGYRNGSHTRRLDTCWGEIVVRRPKVRGASELFTTRVIECYQRRQRALEHGIRAAARQFQCSRNTVRKWLPRYQAEGIKGLRERSRAPGRRPHKTAAHLEAQVIPQRKRANPDVESFHNLVEVQFFDIENSRITSTSHAKTATRPGDLPGASCAAQRHEKTLAFSCFRRRSRYLNHRRALAAGTFDSSGMARGRLIAECLLNRIGCSLAVRHGLKGGQANSAAACSMRCVNSICCCVVGATCHEGRT